MKRDSLDEMVEGDYVMVTHGLMLYRALEFVRAEGYFIERYRTFLDGFRSSMDIEHMSREQAERMVAARSLSRDLVIVALGLGMCLVDAIMLALDYD